VFLKEYLLVTTPISQSLNLLQCEEEAFLGVLLPTLSLTLKQLKDLEGSVTVCSPLLDILLQSVRKRFAPQYKDSECMLASTFHPNFKLAWLDLLAEFDYDVDEMKRRVTADMILLVDKCLMDEKNCDVTNDACDFSNEGKKRRSAIAEDLVESFLSIKTPDAKLTKDVFPHRCFRDLFVKFNTPIPASAAIEGLFTLDDALIKPKQPGLSDQHFGMLAFLKSNAGD